MKKIGIVICAVLLSSTAFSQIEKEKKIVKGEKEVKTENEPKVEEQMEVEKQINVTEENGVTRLKETTIQNGVTQYKVYEGAAAEKRMAELKKEEAKQAGAIKRLETHKKIEVEEREEKAPAKPIKEEIMD